MIHPTWKRGKPNNPLFAVRVLNPNSVVVYNSWDKVPGEQRFKLLNALYTQLKNSERETENTYTLAVRDTGQWVIDSWGTYKGEWLQIQFRFRGYTRREVPLIDLTGVKLVG